MKTAAVVNPASGRGRAGRRWPALARRLALAEARFTERPGHATVLTRELLKAGFDCLLAAGGDGTVNEVANGFFEHGKAVNPEAALGVLPLGSARDFCRSLSLAPGAATMIDVGKAAFHDHSGAPRERYFVNMLSFGFGGEVALRMKESRSGGYLGAALRTFHGFRPVEVCLNGEALSVLHVAIGNGCYQADGMRMCPEANLADGIFEITVAEPPGTVELIRGLYLLYSGNIYRHPKARHRRAERITAVSSDRVLLELDGEPLGRLPLTVEVLPAALRVVGTPLSSTSTPTRAS